MGQICVAEAAKRLGVGVQRIHQRIADGSLEAVRIGSQWIIDDVSLSAVSEFNMPGRPLSHRSAWALVALSEANEQALSALASAERSRARDRLRHLLAQLPPGGPIPEAHVHSAASLLRSWLRNRAERCLYHASPRDMPDLRNDGRVAVSGLSHPRSGIASGGLVEGYIAADDIDLVVHDYVLSPIAAAHDANVVFHVMPADPLAGLGRDNVPILLLAADLVQHRRPREDARAAEILRQIARKHPGLVAEGSQSAGKHRKAFA